MSIVTDLGLFAGGLYACVLIIFTVLACAEGFIRRDGFYLACAAVVVADAAGWLSGATSLGEVGFMLWIAVGFCLGARAFTRPEPQNAGSVQTTRVA